MAATRRAARFLALRLPVPRGEPRLCYGGSVSGGGPATKLEQLRHHFGEHGWRFNIIYLFSAMRPDLELVERAKEKGVRVVLNQNGVYYPAVRPEAWREANERMKRMLALADHVFYQSAFCREAAERFLGPAPGGAEVLYNAVDTKAFRPQGKRRGAVVRLLSTGTISNEGRFRMFENALEALAHLRRLRRDWRYEFAGGFGPPQARLRERAREAVGRRGLSGCVTLSGAFSREEAPLVYARADVHFHFRAMDWCPNAVLEAMASGLPVVYPGAGGAGELVGEEAGLAVPCDVNWETPARFDPRKAAEALAVTMDSARPLGAAARARAKEKFDLQMWLDGHRKVFGELLGKEKGP